MSTASSASDRHDAAIAALAGYDRCVAAGLGTGYPTDDLAAALRAMISPAAVSESVDTIVDRVYREHVEGRATGNLFESLVRAGIQAGWEDWEPETAPGLPSGTVEQLVSEADEALAAYRQTYDTYSEANGGEGSPSTRDYEVYEDSIMDTHMPNVAAILTSLVAALKEQS